MSDDVKMPPGARSWLDKLQPVYIATGQAYLRTDDMDMLLEIARAGLATHGGVPDVEERTIAEYWQGLRDAVRDVPNGSDILGIVHVLRANEFIRGRCMPWPAAIDRECAKRSGQKASVNNQEST